MRLAPYIGNRARTVLNAASRHVPVTWLNSEPDDDECLVDSLDITDAPTGCSPHIGIHEPAAKRFIEGAATGATL